LGGGKSILGGVKRGNILRYDLPFGGGWSVRESVNIDFNGRFLDTSFELDTKSPVIATLLLGSIFFALGLGFIFVTSGDLTSTSLALL